MLPGTGLLPDTSRAAHSDNTKRAEQTTSMRRTLRLIRQDVAPEKKLIGAGVVALLCEVCFRVLEPWPLKIVVDALSVSLGAKVDELSATPALLLTCGARCWPLWVRAPVELPGNGGLFAGGFACRNVVTQPSI